MERLTTFKQQELHVLVHNIYYEICQSARSASLLHVSTAPCKNNPFHFECVVKESNKAIVNLTELYSPTDKRKEEFKLLNHDELIEKAKKFFAEDIF